MPSSDSIRPVVEEEKVAVYTIESEEAERNLDEATAEGIRASKRLRMSEAEDSDAPVQADQQDDVNVEEDLDVLEETWLKNRKREESPG